MTEENKTEIPKKTRVKKTGIIQMCEITKDGNISFSAFDSKLQTKTYCAEVAKGASDKNGLLKTKDGGFILMVAGKFLRYGEVVKKTTELL